MRHVLTIEDLCVSFLSGDSVHPAVRSVSLSVAPGEILALVGESGSGKSATAQTILGLHPPDRVRVTARRLELAGQDVLGATERQLQALRGSAAAMVFQDPMTCLNPTMRVGRQITERLYRQEGRSSAQCRQEALRLLELVQISDAPLRARQYPHQFSGGMRQRVMLAMALAGRPQLLIADEPTTALDVTTQLQILRLMAQLRRETGAAVLLITHDLGVVAHLAHRVAVMYQGRMVETAETESLFARPTHPYTQMLLHSLTQLCPGDLPPLPEGEVESPGCPFAPRCPHCMRVCVREVPPQFSVAPGHQAACWRLHRDAPKEMRHGDTTA